MKKIISVMTLLIMLTCCSGNNLADYLDPDNLSSLIKPVAQEPVTGNEESVTRNNSGWTPGPVPVPVDMAAMRLNATKPKKSLKGQSTKYVCLPIITRLNEENIKVDFNKNQKSDHKGGAIFI